MPKSELNLKDVAIPPHIAAKLDTPEKIKKAKALAKKIEKIKAEVDHSKHLLNLYDKKKDELDSQSDEYSTSQIDDITLKHIQLISENCKIALAAYQKENRFLYRGVGGNPPNAFVSQPREDRKPRDTDRDIHEAFDNLMKAAGIKATRSNSIFTSSSIAGLDQYGAVYIIFPFDGFNFTWSPDHDDLTSSLFQSHGNIDDVLYSLYGIGDKEWNIRSAIDKIQDLVADPDPENMPLYLRDIMKRQEFFDGLVEITGILNVRHKRLLIEVDEVVVKLLKIIKQIMTSDKWQVPIRELNDLLSRMHSTIKFLFSPEAPKDIMNRLAFKTTDFQSAIHSHNEILIQGRYYAFNYNNYINPLSKVLLGGSLRN